MAEVRLADIIEPSVFTDYTRQRTTELSAVFQSGMVAQTAQMNALTAGPASLFNIPFWNPVASVEPNVSSDDPTETSTPQKIAAAVQIGTKQNRNQSWSAMDLTATVSGSDPMAEIGNQVANYWARVYNKTVVQILRGVFADNIANDSGDMVVDSSADLDKVTITADDRLSADLVIDGWGTLGDAMGDVTAIGMHSSVYINLQKQDLIAFRPLSEQGPMFPTYLDKAVVIDDAFPAIAGTNQITYWTVLFGAGAFGYGEGNPRLPTEVDRDPDAGNGAGQETLYSRRDYCFHPGGFSFVGTPAGKTPTNAELSNAASWNRVFERKNIPLALVRTNG